MKGYIFYRLRQIAISIGLVGAAWLARTLLDPVLGAGAPYMFFIIAVIVAALILDLTSTTLAVVLGCLVANWFFEEPRHALSINTLGHWLTGLTYLGIGLAVVWFAKSERSAGLRELAAWVQVRRERANEINFRRLFEQAPVGLAELDVGTNRVLRANARFCELLGWALESLPDKRLSDLVPPVEAEGLLQFARDLRKPSTTSLTWQTRLVQAKGGLLPVTLRIFQGHKDDFCQSLLVAAVEDPARTVL